MRSYPTNSPAAIDRRVLVGALLPTTPNSYSEWNCRRHTVIHFKATTSFGCRGTSTYFREQREKKEQRKKMKKGGKYLYSPVSGEEDPFSFTCERTAHPARNAWIFVACRLTCINFWTSLLAFSPRNHVCIVTTAKPSYFVPRPYFCGFPPTMSFLTANAARSCSSTQDDCRSSALQTSRCTLRRAAKPRKQV